LKNWQTAFVLLSAASLLAGCSMENLPGWSTPTPTATPTITPSPTPVPAALVNGEAIPLEELDHELQRYRQARAAMGYPPGNPKDDQLQVLQSLVEERVAVQASIASGYRVEESQVDSALAAIHQARGGEPAFQSWLAESFYTAEEFRSALRRQLQVQLAADAAASQVPAEAEQVHARHILVADYNTAESLLSQLAGGSDFAATARAYSLDLNTRLNGGDLGWIARQTLILPEVEEAAFGLDAGRISQVVQSPAGFHIVQTLERAESRPLSPAQLETKRQLAVREWLAQWVAKSEIRILLP